MNAATTEAQDAERQAAGDELVQVHQRLGELTRLLHDALHALGHAQGLRSSAESLPDARSRLSYIARLTGEAAEKVLNAVDGARDEQQALGARAGEMAALLKVDPVGTVARGEMLRFIESTGESAERMNSRLTEIMMAQDFHDLTGQVIARVVDLAGNLESQLLQLLVETTPREQRERLETAWLHGPVVDPANRTDIVSDQQQVDDLLDSLGF